MTYLSDLMQKVERQKTLAWLAQMQSQGEFIPPDQSTPAQPYQDMSDQGIQQPAVDQTAGSNDYGSNRAWLSDLQGAGQYMPPDNGNQAWQEGLRSDGQYIPPSSGASQSQVREVDNAAPTGQGWQTGLETTGTPHRSNLEGARAALASIYAPPQARPQQAPPQPQMRPQAQSGVIRNSPAEAAWQSAAQQEELQPNSFRNERTGKVTTLSPPPQGGQTAAQAASLPGADAEGVVIIQRALQPDGSEIQLIKRPGINGAGQQSMITEIRRMVPDALNPAKKAEAEYNLKLAQTKAAQGRTPEEEARSEKLKILAREQAEREASQTRSPEQRQAKAAERLGVRLKPGERIDEVTGQVSAVQGSGEWNKQQQAVLTAKEQRDQFVSHTDQMLKNIDSLIGTEDKPQDHPGYRGATGMIDARLPGFTPEQTNAQVLQKALLAKAAVSGLQDIRKSGTAPGSITEKEWPIFQALNDVLDPTQSEGAYRKSLQDARARLQLAKDNVDRNYRTVVDKYSNVAQPSNQGGSGAAVPVRSEAEARRLPPNTLFVGPDGVTRRTK